MGLIDNLLRRARLRSVKEGKVQTVRAEALENDAKDDAERWQDYGFACNPVDGQGLVINVAGHTIVLRMDRIAERPQLAAHEVSVWHKEGHMVTLKAGRLVEVTCDRLVVNASDSVAITSPNVSVVASGGVSLQTPTVAASAAVTAGSSVSAGASVSAPSVSASGSLKVGGKEMLTHTHGSSGPPN